MTDNPSSAEAIKASCENLRLTAEHWPEAYAAAERAGDALAGAFGQGLRGDALPDGRMYWNIADRVVRPLPGGV